MQAFAMQTSSAARGAAEHYLGFVIQQHAGCYVATPTGWPGEILLADSMPVLRRKIWRWWHQVQ